MGKAEKKWMACVKDDNIILHTSHPIMCKKELNADISVDRDT